MTSLGEVYTGGGGRQVSQRRLYAGVGLFLVGALLVIAGMVVATTDLLLNGGATLLEVREWGGILAGLGAPAVFLGILIVLPSSPNTRAAAIVGASIALLGVALFAHAYPCRWSGANCAPGLPNLTLPVAALYFLGTITTFWCFFVGVASFKTRNDPGGTARLEVTKKGETRIVEVERSRLGGLGGIGFLGATPDGNVETQTNQQRPSARSAPTAPQADGGATTNDIRSPLDDGSTTPEGTSGSGDRYCGNCSAFEYVRTDDGIEPYCGLHDELMDDMDACSQWQGR